MACTSQSALDYVRNARRKLVNGLTGLSVILENLYQKQVFSAEHVSNVEAETNDYNKNRTMLDFVIHNGEEACYELLKILYMTRKRTLGRRDAFDENKRFDLIHWISCYAFTEDTEMEENYLQGSRPCHRYQGKLKSKAQKISKKFWMSSRSLFDENKKPDLSYTSLVLDTHGSVAPSKIKKSKSKKSRMSRPKKLRTYIPEKKADISPSDLLKMDKNLLIVGKPGIGKTALSLEMLRLWSERESKDLDYMFYFDMRETADIKSTVSLEDLLFSKYCEPDEGKDEVLQDLKKYSENVKIIFDGLTDLSSSVVQRLVEKDLLPDATIILTCRPDDEDDFFSPEDCLTVEVKGFNEQTINSYLSGALGEDEEKVLSNVELLTLCHVPMYALMVVACFSSEVSTQPRTTTEIYISIVRFCLQTNSNKTKTKHLNSFIRSKSKEILSLAEVAFHATLRKTVNLEKVVCEDNCVLSFLKPLVIKVDFTEAITTHAFLHYTVQEFFAALWLLINPDKIREIFQQCLTEEQKHMKHLIPFMCRLLNEKKPSLMNCLIPVEEINKTSEWFFKEMKTTFLPAAHTEDTGLDDNLPFLCQCLYESQRRELCIYLLDKLDYSLDLSGENLDPYTCCAVAYLVTQSEERKVCLNLEDVTVSEEGMRRLFGCLGNVQNIQWRDPLPQHLWKIFLLSDWQMDSVTIIRLFGNQLHLPVEGKRQLFDKAVEVIQKMTEKVNVCLYWGGEAPFCHNLTESLFKVLSNINSLSFTRRKCHETHEREQKRLLLHLCLKAALDNDQTFYNAVNQLCSLMPVQTNLFDILFDLYQHVKSEELSLHPSLLSVFQSPPVWSIKLSERKTPILLEVLKLQSEKKPVELVDCSHEESEVKDFLECLPYISQLRLFPRSSDDKTRLFVNLFCAAAEREQQTGEKMLEMLSSVLPDREYPIHRMDYKKTYDPDFLLDLYVQMKNYETKTGLSLLPSLQPVIQSSHPVWYIYLSERKTSVLLEVLKLQSEKKSVKLTYCSHEESEVKIFLQCLPYISQLGLFFGSSERTRFLVNLFCAAAEREQQTGEKMLEMLSSVLPDEEDPIHRINNDKKKYVSGFLLDLYIQMKDYETKTGLSLLPSLQPVFQSSPPVWFIDLSERKTSVLLEVLKLQSEKKSVMLIDCSHEESEVKIFLQCLPYISQLRLVPRSSDLEERTRLLVNLFCAAAEREQQTGEKMLEMLSSVLPDEESPIYWMNNDKKTYDPGFLLELYVQMKNYETKTGLSLLPSLQPFFQSSPPDWYIKLSERKTSVLLEVLKLQSEKKSVELIYWSHEESEVTIFLQCLPYISQLRLVPRSSDRTRLFVNLFCAAAEREQQTGEKMLEMLSSVLPDRENPIHWMNNDKKTYDTGFLLDLYVQMKNYETKTGLSLLPSLQPVFQSSPPVWSIDLSERKTSVLLEVLKLQSEKKSVELKDWSHEESDVKIFLQCLPYFSQLGCAPAFFQLVCTSISVRSREDLQQLVSLLKLLDFQLQLTGKLCRKTCSSVGRVLKMCSSKVDLILTSSKMSVRGAALLFRYTTQLHSLKLSNNMTTFLLRWFRRGRLILPLAVEELCLVSKKVQPAERVLKVVSSLASLLRYWTVGRLDLTEFSIPAQHLITLLLHDAPLTIRLSKVNIQQLLEIQDENLTVSLLGMVGGDLTSFCLSWELLQHLLQLPSAQTITVDLRKNRSLQQRAADLLPCVDRIVFKRPSPSFVRMIIRELYRAHARVMVPSLLRSLDHVINLSCRELDSVDCAALLFILKHSDGVKLKLLWTIIPAEGIQSILLTLDKVTDLSVDRDQLLRFIHCCASSDGHQEAASALLKTLHHRLDVSCSSCVALPEEDQTDPPSLTTGDCRAICTILRHSSQETQLHLKDCEVEDSGLDLLFPVLDRVCLRVSKTVLLQLLSLIPVNSERDTARRAVTLCRALGGELDLSHTALDERLCGALVQILDLSEELTELDLSHCQLTDSLLLELVPHLHKVHILDLSDNRITDATTNDLVQLVSVNPSMDSIRLFGNNIVDKTRFQEHKQFEM